jgi:hypothetical protein
MITYGGLQSIELDDLYLNRAFCYPQNISRMYLASSLAVTNWVRHPAKSRSRDLPRDLSRDFMTPYAIM